MRWSTVFCYTKSRVSDASRSNGQQMAMDLAKAIMEKAAGDKKHSIFAMTAAEPRPHAGTHLFLAGCYIPLDRQPIPALSCSTPCLRRTLITPLPPSGIN